MDMEERKDKPGRSLRVNVCYEWVLNMTLAVVERYLLVVSEVNYY
jgi:hypothetical protein